MLSNTYPVSDGNRQTACSAPFLAFTYLLNGNHTLLLEAHVPEDCQNIWDKKNRKKDGDQVNDGMASDEVRSINSQTTTWAARTGSKQWHQHQRLPWLLLLRISRTPPEKNQHRQIIQVTNTPSPLSETSWLLDMQSIILQMLHIKKENTETPNSWHHHHHARSQCSC